MRLKKFIKYFDDMNDFLIYDWNIAPEDDSYRAEKCLLFKGAVFDKGARKKLKKLYKQGYKLERNDDGMAVILFPYKNEHGANLVNVQINVKKSNKHT